MKKGPSEKFCSFWDGSFEIVCQPCLAGIKFAQGEAPILSIRLAGPVPSLL